MNEPRLTLVTSDLPPVEASGSGQGSSEASRLRAIALAVAALLFVAFVALVAFGPLGQLAETAAPNSGAAAAQAGMVSAPSHVPFSRVATTRWKTYFTGEAAVAVPGYWRPVGAPPHRWQYGSQLQLSIGVGDDQGNFSTCLPDDCHRTHVATLSSLRRALMRLLAAQGLTEQTFVDVAMGGAKASAVCGAQPQSHLVRAAWCLAFDIRGGRTVVAAMRHYGPIGRGTTQSAFPSDMQRQILAGLHVAEDS